LNDSENSLPLTVDGQAGWFPAADGPPTIRFRVRRICANDHAVAPDITNWSPRVSVSIRDDVDGEPSESLVVEKWRGETDTPDDATAPSEQALDDHHRLAAQKARSIARRLGMRQEHAIMLEIAARLHDEGKRCEKWQDAFAAPRNGRPFAKTRGPVNQRLLDGYRHELGSEPRARQDKELQSLPAELQDLALHLITAHHGFGRPIIDARGCPDAPPSVLKEQEREAASRVLRLQRQWGPWGLAWWEALLRAADQQASRELESEPREASTHCSHG
jgi:CRISPR-associated endonuclease/helicase Cas3